MEVKFNYTVNEIENRIICDTNIWYYIASKQISVEKNILTATAFSIEELATSPSQVKDVKFYQEVIKAIKEYSTPIMALNPFDFVLSNHDNTFPNNEKYFEQILVYFTRILTSEIPDDFVLDEGGSISTIF